MEIISKFSKAQLVEKILVVGLKFGLVCSYEYNMSSARLFQ